MFIIIYSLYSFGEKLLLLRYKDKNPGMARICQMSHYEKGCEKAELRALQSILQVDTMPPSHWIFKYRNKCAKMHRIEWCFWNYSDSFDWSRNFLLWGCFVQPQYECPCLVFRILFCCVWLLYLEGCSFLKGIGGTSGRDRRWGRIWKEWGEEKLWLGCWDVLYERRIHCQQKSI